MEKELNQMKYDEIMAELESLRKKIRETDRYLNGNVIEINFLKNALEFSDLDGIEEYCDENIIILHKNCFRTNSIVYACRPKSGREYHFHKTPDEVMTPEYLLKIIECADSGTYILLKSNVFSLSDKFESIILDAISKEKVFFVICTNRLENIPVSIREKMRVME